MNRSKLQQLHHISNNRRMKKEFSIRYPLSIKVVRDLKIVTDTVGELLVEGTITCYPAADFDERFSLGIDFVYWHGTDILPVLQVFDDLWMIEEYCLPIAAQLFNDQQQEVA